MDTWLPLIKAWKQKDIKKPHKLLKKIFESSFTFDTFKLFFHQKKLTWFQFRLQMAHGIDLKRTGQIGKKWGFS